MKRLLHRTLVRLKKLYGGNDVHQLSAVAAFFVRQHRIAADRIVDNENKH